MNKKERQESPRNFKNKCTKQQNCFDFELAAQTKDMVLELKSMD